MNCDTNELNNQKVEKSSQSAKWRSVCTRVKPESIFRGKLWHKRIRIRAQVCASVWCGPCVGNTIGAQTTNRRFSLASRPPHSHSWTTTFSYPPIQEHRIFANLPLVEIHGSHQGKLTTSFSQGSPPLTDFLTICQQTARKSTGGG